MPFTEHQYQQFTAILQSKGWTMVNDTLWSPSRGLYFNHSHFEHWSPSEMCEIFSRRSERIQEAAFENWAQTVDEHRDVCLAAEHVFSA
jgi:hypothetical protein